MCFFVNENLWNVFSFLLENTAKGFLVKGTQGFGGCSIISRRKREVYVVCVQENFHLAFSGFEGGKQNTGISFLPSKHVQLKFRSLSQ